jgi:hypothetical protein
VRPAAPVCAKFVALVQLRMSRNSFFECPAYGETRSRRKFICLFKAPWSLETVLEDNSPLISEYMSLCLELREAHLAKI